MSITTVIAIYFVLWWVVLFAVLPWGIRSQHESGEEIAPGTDPGAPATHVIGRKLLWTTIYTSVIFAILYVLYTQNLIPFDWLGAISTPPRQQ